MAVLLVLHGGESFSIIDPTGLGRAVFESFKEILSLIIPYPEALELVRVILLTLLASRLLSALT
jgi:hypothetical protein